MEFSKVVDYFLANEGDFTSEECRIDNGRLYLRGDLIAMKTNGDVLISHEIQPHESDVLIFGIAKSGRTFRRTPLDDMFNSTLRVKELEAGELDKFSTIANLFGLEFTEAELNSFKIANAFRERVITFFNEKQVEEREIKRLAELAALDAITREETEKWDKGEGANRNNTVKGAGGGLRLRLVKSGSKQLVYTNRNEKTTINVVKRAWNFACEYWYCGKEFSTYNEATKKLTSGSYYNQGRSATVKPKSVSIGCQTIGKEEAERFADLMGWNREGTN